MAMVVSCSSNGDNSGIETVELQDLVPQDVNISSFTTGVETVGLESREDCLVGMIRDLEIGDTRIYISDLVTRSILIFDRSDGTFLSKLHKQGRGPGEYLEITDFCVDDAAGTIEIFDGSAGHLLTYDSNSLEFLESEDVPLLAPGGFLKKDGIYYYCNIATPFIIEENTIKYIDYDLDLRIFPTGEFKILDKLEYEYHKKIMNYSKKLDKVIKGSIDNEVRNAAYTIIKGKGSTYFGIASATQYICNSIISDKHAILTVSSHHDEGIGGYGDIC